MREVGTNLEPGWPGCSERRSERLRTYVTGSSKRNRKPEEGGTALKRRMAVGSAIAILLVALFAAAALATDAKMYFSSDNKGQNPVTNVKEGDQVFIVVDDPDENIDCDLRDKIWTDVKIFDPKTGAYSIWVSYSACTSGRPWRSATRARPDARRRATTSRRRVRTPASSCRTTPSASGRARTSHRRVGRTPTSSTRSPSTSSSGGTTSTPTA